MKRPHYLVFGVLLAGVVVGLVWTFLLPAEPAYGGKKLSAWADELTAIRADVSHRGTRGQEHVKAIRAIGTNAIPWLLAQYRHGSVWQWRMNQLLDKQHLVKLRFPDPDLGAIRATTGFIALGDAAEPGIPALLARVEAFPGYIPGALVGIGHPAVPALLQCLTNATLVETSGGTYAPIPGNTLSYILNATSLGPSPTLSKSEVALFLPAIQAWANQTTNQLAQMKAQSFLSQYDEMR